MKLVIQRVKKAQVEVENKIVGKIEKGFSKFGYRFARNSKFSILVVLDNM